MGYSQRLLSGGPVTWQRLARFRLAAAAITEEAGKCAEVLVDLGAADGIGLPFLRPLAKRYIGVNYYPDHSRQFKDRHPDEDVISADGRRLPFAAQSIDTVVSLETLHLLPSREDRQRCLREVRRVLRPGGLFVCSVPIEVGWPAILKWAARRATGFDLEGMTLWRALEHSLHRVVDVTRYDRGRQVGFDAYRFADDVAGIFERRQARPVPLRHVLRTNLLLVSRRSP